MRDTTQSTTFSTSAPTLLLSFFATGPTALGLGVVPALPYLFDEPVEIGVEKGFNMLLGWKERLPHHHHAAAERGHLEGSVAPIAVAAGKEKKE